MALTLDSFKIDAKKATPEQVAAALELLAKERFTKERIKAGELKGATSKKVADMTPEEKKVYQAASAKYTANNSLLMAKCKKLGITNTDAEIAAYQKDKTAVDVTKYKK